jgi:hypothetical protein
MIIDQQVDRATGIVDRQKWSIERLKVWIDRHEF